ncbi:MAG: tetratricopeptide repeat protein [Desulfuromonadaceae bacterium]|nr:tetratricopeptide repeat protein [Desulfuromonadaceae bacterium]
MKDLIALVLFAVVGLTGSAHAANDVTPRQIHLQLAQRHLEAGRPFWALSSLRHALEQGTDDPNIHRQQAQILYDLGFVDQAVSEMEQTLRRATDEDYLYMELGVFALAGGQLAKARQAFERVLELNPGFSFGYYYLGEVLFRLGDYDRSACALVLARQLGLPGFELERKLTDFGQTLPEHPWPADGSAIFLRRISLVDGALAEVVLRRLGEGELFEELAREFSTGEEKDSGGYVGMLQPQDLNPQLAATLSGLNSFERPVLIQHDDQSWIVQRIAPFDPAFWTRYLTRKASNDLSKRDQTVVDSQTELSFHLMAGAFHCREYADDCLRTLRRLGFEQAMIQKIETPERRYDVIAGLYADYPSAVAAQKQLKAAGQDCYIKKD